MTTLSKTLTEVPVTLETQHTVALGNNLTLHHSVLHLIPSLWRCLTGISCLTQPKSNSYSSFSNLFFSNLPYLWNDNSILLVPQVKKFGIILISFLSFISHMYFLSKIYSVYLQDISKILSFLLPYHCLHYCLPSSSFGPPTYVVPWDPLFFDMPSILWPKCGK